MDSNKLLNLREIEKETLANRLVTVKDSKKIKKLLKNRFFPLNEYQKVSRNNLNTLKKGKKFNKLSKKEEQYYEFLYDFLFKIDTNIVEIAKGLKQLIGKKNLMPSIFLLRGMMEIIFFNIFVTMKCFLNIKKNNTDVLIDTILRASLASDVDGIKQDYLKSESAIYKKIITNYKGRRIHINDCIRFYKKNLVCKIFKFEENNKSKIYQDLNKKIKPKKNDEMYNMIYSIITDEDLSKITNETILKTYDRMCEIIHPTAIKIYDATDEKIQYDFREFYLTLIDSPLFLTNLYTMHYKEFICDWFLENKNLFIDAFNKKLNKVL